MGNKQSARKKSTDQLNGPSTKSNGSSRESSNLTSPSEPIGAVPYKYGEDRKVQVKIYNSYSNLTNGNRVGGGAELNPDIKIYRRSTTGRDTCNGSDESYTLPRNFGRSKSAMSGFTNGYQYNSSTLRNYSELKQRQSARDVADGRTPRKLSSSSSMLSIGYKVSPDNFPDTCSIKKKLLQFETHFAKSFSEIYSLLPGTVQLSAISIAIHTANSNQQVSLYDYLQQSTDIPLDLLESTDYMLTIPTALFYGISHVRRDKITDKESWSSLALEVVTCLAVEAASDISRIFEYQIALLNEEISIRILGAHAASCVVDYLKRYNKYLDRNTIVQGVIMGRPANPDGVPKFISVIIGQRELKWNLYEIFNQPGLRQELYIYSSDSFLDPESSPWRYLANENCNPQLYGYRALLLQWDFLQGHYKIDNEDTAAFRDEVSWHFDDFHRLYNPYKRLIGQRVMQQYCSNKTSGRTSGSLAEFVNHLQGSNRSRNEIQPIYRPISPVNVQTSELMQSATDQNPAPLAVIETESPASNIPAKKKKSRLSPEKSPATIVDEHTKLSDRVYTDESMHQFYSDNQVRSDTEDMYRHPNSIPVTGSTSQRRTITSDV